LHILLEHPTIAELAEWIAQEEARRHTEEAGLPPIMPVSRAQDLPLSFAQQRLWFLDQLEPGSTAYTIPHSVRLLGKLAIEIWEETWRQVLRRNESLRTVFQIRENQPAQIILEGKDFSIPLVCLGALPAAERSLHAQRLASLEAQSPFNLARGPLVRMILLRF